jgi:DNA helicase-2/ATP-dependent DNA helicase PcrA
LQLDEFQQAAATATEPRVLVTACPGSGKTRTLVARFEHLVSERHINPSLITCITFTRYGAGEIRDRLGPKIASRAFLGTFHSFALQIIKMYGSEIGYEGHWLGIAPEEEVDLEELAVLKDMGLINSKGAWTRCKAHDWAEYRNRKVNGAETPPWPLPFEEDFDLVWKTLMDRFRAENVLTFGTMILEAIALLEIDEIREQVQKRFRHVLIDESQDCDSRQWRMLELLDPETLFVVGDVDQAIYSWRGSRPELFIDFASKAARYDLPNSYRFGFNIAAPANALIRHNIARLDTAITAISENHGSVQVVKDVQPGQIADIIREELKTYAPSQIAVLARRHSTLDELARELKMHRDIPFTQIGGAEEVPKTGAFRTVRGYLRLAVNPKDARAFMAIATAERISTGALIDLRAKANAGKASLAEAYGMEMPKNLGSIQARLHDSDPHTDYLPAIKYMQEIMLAEAIIDTQELLEVLSMETHQDRMRTVQDTVVLSTIHAAKGLEWPVVLVIGLNADQFPSKRSMREGREEEERRLAYVAFTRAEEKLYLVHAPPQSADDGASRFLSEIGDVTQLVSDQFKGDNLVF